MRVPSVVRCFRQMSSIITRFTQLWEPVFVIFQNARSIGSPASYFLDESPLIYYYLDGFDPYDMEPSTHLLLPKLTIKTPSNTIYLR